MNNRSAGLRRGRQRAASMMTDFCVVERKTDDFESDPATDTDVPIWRELYRTIGRVTGELRPMEAEVGGRTVASTEPEWHSPVPAQARAEEALPGDRVRLIELGPDTDPGLLGVPFFIISTPFRSQQTARRWPVRRNES